MKARDVRLPLAWCFLVVLAATAAEPEVLDNEAVVRRLEAGERPESVIDAIRRSRCDFDLSPDAIEELIRAGVPQAVISAMRERRAQASPSPGPSAVAIARTRIELRLERIDRGGAPPTISLPRTLPGRAAPALGLPLGAEDYRLEDVAVFLACTSSDHVPDGWKATSPMGRDFPRTPRHEMLAFRSAGASSSSTSAGNLVLSDLSPLEALVASGVEHDWLVGIALQVSGRWRLLASASLLDQRVDDPPGTWTATLRIPPENPLAIEIRIRASAIRASTPPPPPS